MGSSSPAVNHARTEAGHARESTHGTALRPVALAFGCFLLIAGVFLSLFVGSGDIEPGRVVDALTSGGAETNDLLVVQFRVPRTILAIVVGIALSLAGVVMQALTRNPLADPGLLGVNAGAYFAIVFGTAFLGVGAGSGQVFLGIAGAGISAAIVYIMASTGVAAHTVVKLVLAGVALGAVLSGVSQAIVRSDPDVFDRIRFWSLGSFQGRQFDTVETVWPIVAMGVVVVILLGGSLNALSMDDDVARALGTNLTLVRGAGFVAVTMLCGAATAAVGPLVFVGLVVPFVARFCVGVDHRWIIAFSIIFGPVLLLLSDVLGRVLVSSELPVGVVTAFVGAPVLISLVRRTTLRSL